MEKRRYLYYNLKKIDKHKNDIIYKYIIDKNIECNENNNGLLFVNKEDSKLMSISNNIRKITYGKIGEISASLASNTNSDFVMLNYKGLNIKSNLNLYDFPDSIPLTIK